ncbi:FHA domain-containing protein [Smaragdicoccus niigatensis]|uniref:FHA domain-containing protein n=1 Tax=Smaragdicoccus niigatensis TaxID=359359 RepID=UPI0003687F63|nr:FHA domain-containing protein [Smaragdicoccus niigatensis]
MSAHLCPKGHLSGEPDYCDTCGAPIGGVPTAILPTLPMSNKVDEQAGGDSATCPVCGAPQVAGDRFCENDGFDFTSGRLPAGYTGQSPAVTAPAPVAKPDDASPWIVRVEADHAYYLRSGADEIEFPAVCPGREFVLRGAEVRIGRRSPSRGISPEIDLTGPPLDPGISHLHAVLRATADGWELTDVGSANGTTVNGASAAIPYSVPVPLSDGDRVHVGAWTTLTIHAPA